MGTVLLSVLYGHWRYAHINAVRGDGINPGLLGMRSTVSEDVVRMAMSRIGEEAGLDWLSSQVLGSIAPALALPWILDIDVTVKPLYGNQQGSEVGYNPEDPPTSITATLWRICGSVWALKFVLAMNTPPRRDCPVSGKPLKNFPGPGGRRSFEATAGTAVKRSCWSVKHAAFPISLSYVIR
jgi:hypothetical protein